MEAFGNFWEVTFGVSVTFGKDFEGGPQHPKSQSKVAKSSEVAFAQVSKSHRQVVLNFPKVGQKLPKAQK